MGKIKLEEVKQFLLKKDNLLILILTGVLLLVIAWPISEETVMGNEVSGLWDRSGDKIQKTEESFGKSYELNGELTLENSSREDYIVNRLEQKLEGILASMHGVGKVKVMITLSSSGEKVVAKDIPLERNNIVEKDSGGGNRSTNEMYSQEETVYRTTADGEKIPYVIKENYATVEGVSVVAEGGDNALVQKNISEIIQALFGIEEHKIKVVKMKQEE